MVNDSLPSWRISIQNRQAAARSFLFLTRDCVGGAAKVAAWGLSVCLTYVYAWISSETCLSVTLVLLFYSLSANIGSDVVHSSLTD